MTEISRHAGHGVGDPIRIHQIPAGGAADLEEGAEIRRKNPAAQELGRLGGKRRAETMTPERRAEIARKAAESRWRKGAE